MIWINTTIYYCASGAVMWIGFWLYARLLMNVGKATRPTKYILAILIYLFFACLLVSPLLIALRLFPDWQEEVRNNNYYMIYFLGCYVLSLLPGGIHFKKHHLSSLKDHGFFS